MKDLIGVFDSGIGGLSIIEKLRLELPHETFLYYADTINCPYGNKSSSELLEITSNIVSYLQKEGCKLIVIACNTATTKCLKELRNRFPKLIFVGVVPAIKVACDFNYQNTLVLATPATIESERTNELVTQYKRNNQNIYLASCEGLALAIEQGNKEEVNKILDNVLGKYKDKNIDSIVLGCTHYPFIKNEILQRMPQAVLLDGSKGVANEVKHQLQLANITTKNKKEGTVYMINSKNLTKKTEK